MSIYLNNLSTNSLYKEIEGSTSQLLRSSQEYLVNDNFSSLFPSSNVYPLGDLFHSLPEAVYPGLNTTNNKNIPLPENNNRWMNILYDQHTDSQTRQKSVEHTSPPLTGTTNAQGTFIPNTEDYKPKKRPKDEPILDHERALKKKRRLEKNREAAQLFRHRQKARVQELEKTVEDLTCNNNEVRMKLELLTFENKILKDQLLYLRNLISSGAIPLPPTSGSLEKADLSLTTSSSTNSAVMTTAFVNNTASLSQAFHPIPAPHLSNTTNVNSCDITTNTPTNFVTTTSNHDSTTNNFVTTTNNNDSTTNSTTSNNNILTTNASANNVSPTLNLNRMVAEHIL